MVKTKWLASLSDGSTAIEGDAPFDIVKGELSPWLKFKAHLEATGLRITGMRIQVFKPGEATRTYNLPSQHQTPKGNHEKWVSLYPIAPVGYDCWRWVTSALLGGKETHQIEIRAYFTGLPDISLFVDEDEGNECWVVVHEEE